MMDQFSALVTSIPKDKLSQLLDETFTGLNGAGPDLQIADRLVVEGRTRIQRRRRPMHPPLIDDAAPVLDSQAASADALRGWTP